jgi:hypothetical protein
LNRWGFYNAESLQVRPAGSSYTQKDIMKNTFEILAGFLDRCDDQVEGRELQALTPDVQVKLGDFARGKLPRAEQVELMTQLNRHPQWIERLAEEVKAMRRQSSRG